MKLNGTLQLLVFADDGNILRGRIHAIKKTQKETLEYRKKALVGTAKETAEKTECMVVSQPQNAEQNQNITVGNMFFKRVEELKYLVPTMINQNSIHGKIQSILKLGNACSHFVQNLLFSSSLSKSIKIKIFRTLSLLVVLCGCETWSLILRDKCRLRVFENRVLRRKFGPQKDEVTGVV